jgi:hypothetical protein
MLNTFNLLWNVYWEICGPWGMIGLILFGLAAGDYLSALVCFLQTKWRQR